MKYTSAAIGTLLSKFKADQIHALLLYGPDKGLISHLCEEVVKISGKALSSISYKEAQSKGIDVVLNNISLFGGSEIVKIFDASTAIDDGFKDLLLRRTHNFPILIADELSPNSALRKFFETEALLAAFGCYPDDEKSVAQIIRQKVLENAKKITSDAVVYLSNNLSGDRLLIVSELEKLLYFTHDRDLIGLDDVMKIIGSNLVISPDQMCIAFAKGNAEEYLNELSKLNNENISPVWIIRALVRYYINLYIVISLKENGVPIDTAMQSLKPPIFFKYAEDFRQIASRRKKADIVRVLKLLRLAEIDSKSSIATHNICEVLFFSAQAIC